MNIKSGSWIFFILLAISSAQSHGQARTANIDGCVCFYFNRLHVQDNHINFGLYNIEVLEMLKSPDYTRQDSVLFFKSAHNKKINLVEKIKKFHLYDVPNFDYYNLLSLKNIIDNDTLTDSVKILHSIFNSVNEVLHRYDFEIMSWMDRRPAYKSVNRISKKKGIYIQCKPINAIWYLARYPNLKSKLTDLELTLSSRNPEFFWEINKRIRISYKDTNVIAYPMILK